MRLIVFLAEFQCFRVCGMW
ncbi:TPA: hypothetical protein N0F65_000155 [Lagenidium giganteum]|uniref:Uncharacterized protein n=1 Tax=Lagenidium giganteum TaxID=4803 RepID=A0AAV2YLH1_9STRA|nr:TPA: hypothetical protein N0F65_000155 [Lagenidium giganteum]